MKLNRPVDDRALYAEALRHGMTFTPGAAVTAERPFETHMRSLSRCWTRRSSTKASSASHGLCVRFGAAIVARRQSRFPNRLPPGTVGR